MTGNTHKKSTGSRAGLSRTRLRGSAILMTIAILGITGFQIYWLKNNFDREKQTLDIKTSAAFRETVEQVQASKLRLERIMINVDSAMVTPAIPDNNFRPLRPAARRIKSGPPREKEITMLRLIQDKLRDSLIKDTSGKRPFFITVKKDSLGKTLRDSLIKLRGSVNTIRISQTFDSLPGTEMIREMHVNKRPGSPSGTGGGIVTVGYGRKPTGLKDTIVVKGRTSIERLPDIPLPAQPRGGWDGRHSDGNAVFQFLYNVDSVWVKDSATVKEITQAYDKRLNREEINIGFHVNRVDGLIKDTLHTVTIGFSTPIGFQLSLHNSFNYMFDKLKLPILFSLLLVGITIASFVLLYRNMLKQKRLAELKNEFISNITHELKTPIATVGVAIEALKSFNAMDDPKRTQEYLSISQNELQRLNLLVDKVLKLSMFEKKEIDLKYELINLKDVVDEVTASMRLQIEKYRASVTTNVEGDCTLQGDRLHLLSVVFNLLDNALKYGGDAPVIQISLEEKENSIEMTMADNGIGISPEYKDKVFEKFFRVPHGDTHNAKGYGLGLSYTAHVIKKHRGTIRLATEPGKGATFIITLPKQNT